MNRNRKLKEGEVSVDRTLGSRLGRERVQQGLSQLDLSRRTKLRVSVIERLEADDWTGLTPFYARRFGLTYSRALGLPDSEVSSLLPDSGPGFATEGYEYIRNVQHGVAPLNSTCRRDLFRPKRGRALAKLVMFCLFGVFAWQLGMTWRKIERLRPSTDHVVAEPVVSQALIADAGKKSTANEDPLWGGVDWRSVSRDDKEWLGVDSHEQSGRADRRD